MESTGELAWFRTELLRSLLHPNDFARSLAREHYGLAGVLVALLSGAAASIAIDALVLATKGFVFLAFLPQLVIDAVFLGARLAVTVAVIATAVHYALRASRRAALGLDQAFTAFSFALVPLVLAPIAAVLVLLPELIVAAALVVLAIVLRTVIGIGLNLRALLPPAVALAVFVATIILGALVLQDQVSRVRYSLYAAVPQLVPELAATPMAGARAETADFAITLPSGWTNATTGLRGEAARYVSPTADLRVARARGLPLATADSYADTIEAIEDRGLESAWSERSVVRIAGVIVVDDRYGGVLDGRRIVYRQFTAVPTTQGFALIFHYVDPPDQRAALDEAASIAVTWRLTR